MTDKTELDYKKLGEKLREQINEKEKSIAQVQLQKNAEIQEIQEKQKLQEGNVWIWFNEIVYHDFKILKQRQESAQKKKEANNYFKQTLDYSKNRNNVYLQI